MIIKRLRRTACLAAVAALATWLAGCAGSGPLRATLREDVRRPVPGAILFLCDGLNSDLVARGTREGWLPNIDRRFIRGGTRVEHAVTVVPGVTYAAIATFVTGVTPATHGIPGNRWFDPDQRLFRNYVTIRNYRDVNSDFDVPTIYERIAPLRSTSIQTAHIRGVTDNIANWAQSGVRWYFGAYTGVDALTATTVELVARRANRRGQWPALLTCYFPGLDTIGHLHGASSTEYREAIKHFDHHLGRVCNWLETQGLLDTTYLVLLSDHGMVDVRPGGYIDLTHLVRDIWGLNATDKMLQEGSFTHRRRYFDRYDTVVCHQDGRKASLYFAGPAGWDENPGPETVARILTTPSPEYRLWNIEGIDLVAYLASEDEAIIRSPHGSARIVERSTPSGVEYRYIPVPDDVLGYQAGDDLAAFVAAGYHDSRAWLRATCGHPYPDVVPQLIPLLRHRRFGQVLIFTSPGYSFNDEAGGHGGLRQREMSMVMMFAGPGIAPGSTLECARAVDVVPTLLMLLGLELPNDGSLEGVPLFADVPVHSMTELTQP